jgi:hypothetical protein
MKKLTILILFLICGLLQLWPCFASSTLEVDLTEKRIRFVDFKFGDNTVSGEIFFQFQQENDVLDLALEGHSLTLNDQYIPWASAKLIKKGGLVFVNELHILNYFAKGVINIKEKKLSLDIKGGWKAASEFLEGDITVEGKAWGAFDNIVMSGYLTVDNGIYEGQEFLKLRLDLLGKPPVFNITDSEIVLYDGTTFEYVDAVLDIRNFSEPTIPNAEFVSQKVYLGDWQVFAEDKNHVGLRKNLGKQVDVFIDTPEVNKNGGTSLGSGTELRYNWKDAQFLKLRMEEDRAILGFEQRRDF